MMRMDSFSLVESVFFGHRPSDASGDNMLILLHNARGGLRLPANRAIQVVVIKGEMEIRPHDLKGNMLKIKGKTTSFGPLVSFHGIAIGASRGVPENNGLTYTL
jgi:hypothetical protein